MGKEDEAHQAGSLYIDSGYSREEKSRGGMAEKWVEESVNQSMSF